ncbi:aldo/keto reductase [Clostridium pasteurianum]|uniref:Putative oxidoreductase, aryl-alcohol dehydrogenase like protein n=1 Tax=Clostridium pasteurianum BC1 TaxID=86416 RepID=R4KCM4_CLOPA|nr:aldo/keto reductase [Clostridium pasteurianum]AGK99431.1 putative oxidoreductase, aryl-alcohol dehydrogenase like protein [Clostridium pasteurianum BC1]
MEYTEIDKTNLKKLSTVALGTWAIGGSDWGGTDVKQSISTIHHALDLGINVIDTAPAYGRGESEKIVGEAIKNISRDSFYIATKVGLDWSKGDGLVYRNNTKENILKEIDDSLRRLQTDYIDIYQIHWPDPLTPIEETAMTMKSLLDAGKIRAIGVSNFSVEQIETFKKFAPVHTVQPPYNIFEQDFKNELLPYVKNENMTALYYGSICRGLLSGRMTADSKFNGDDLRNADPKFQPDRFPSYINAVEALDKWAKESYGKSIISLAIRWLIDQPISGIALWGARRPEQLNAVEGVGGWRLTEEDYKTIESIVNKYVKEPVGPEFMAPPVRTL